MGRVSDTGIGGLDLLVHWPLLCIEVTLTTSNQATAGSGFGSCCIWLSLININSFFFLHLGYCNSENLPPLPFFSLAHSTINLALCVAYWTGLMKDFQLVIRLCSAAALAYVNMWICRVYVLCCLFKVMAIFLLSVSYVCCYDYNSILHLLLGLLGTLRRKNIYHKSFVWAATRIVLPRPYNAFLHVLLLLVH